MYFEGLQQRYPGRTTRLRPSPEVPPRAADRKGSGFVAERCLVVIQLYCEAKFGLALALLVTWVLADDHDATVATNDLALVANLLDAWVYLHVSYFCLGLLLTGFKTLVRLSQSPSLYL
ncbi:MAG: hypothetical protein RL672_433 [Actinomycetota bacterium]